MVKKIVICIITLIFILTVGCGFDFLGIAISEDLDTRLEERDNFALLDGMGWRHALKELGDEYEFLVVTDIHMDKGNTQGFEKMKRVVDEGDYKFMVVLGDISDWGARRDLQNFLDIAKTFGIPVYPVVGNHDIQSDNWSVWKELIGSTRYRIDAGTTTLFMMDNANLYFGKAQMDWLERELKSTSAKEHVFVFTHAHFFTLMPAGAKQHDMKERMRVTEILNGKCDAVFSGHKHMGTEEREAGRVKYINVNDFKDHKYYYIVAVKGGRVTYGDGRL